MSKMLSKLLPELKVSKDVLIKGLADDSRLVCSGELYLAVEGDVFNGADFINQAMQKNVAAVVSDQPVDKSESSTWKAPVYYLRDLARLRGEIASRYYDEPSTKMRVIAITGTNGKTSCSHFIAKTLAVLGIPCGFIGTLGAGVEGLSGDAVDLNMTTPGAIALQQTLKVFSDRGVSMVSLEASSHGLIQERLRGTDINTAVLTNISRDHLDFHGTFEAYTQAKARLFQFNSLQNVILNADDDSAEAFSRLVNEGVNVVTYSLHNSSADVHCKTLSLSSSGIDATVVTPWGDIEIVCSLLGMFNVSNVLAVISALGCNDYRLSDIALGLSKLETVEGRMDLIALGNGVDVIIDYAHTPDALEKALSGIRSHCRGAVWCVMGCGGDRDKGKRSQMGAVAARLANRTVVTSDNPRSEDPLKIIRDVLQGVSDGQVESGEVSALTDRGEAIAYALSNAKPGDMVLIAGKGHEKYQELSNGRVDYSDYSEVEKWQLGKSDVDGPEET
jgi:UDP-N-acetylmuramoyl-L-alanyl-D-glutamate--2,6-diaminopimelate ligase